MTAISSGIYCPAMPATRKKQSAAKKTSKKDFTSVFNALRDLLNPYARELKAASDKPSYYCLESKTPTLRNRPMYFAGVRMGKNYVSYYLMSVYASPEFIRGMSPELKKRMQGKACFNFAEVDEKLFAELAQLTQAGFEKFKSMKFL
jgi:hypothetical protein